jgi:hypothetical protein
MNCFNLFTDEESVFSEFALTKEQSDGVIA